MTWARVLVIGLLSIGRAVAADRVPLDTATVEQLDAIDGIGTDAAKAIVAWRTAHDGLRTVDELRGVAGVDVAALDSLRQGTWVTLDVPARPVAGYRSADEVLAAFDVEPDVQRVQQWAAAEAQVRPETMRSWLRAARSFALLPQLRVEVKVGDDWSNDFSAFDAWGNTPTSADVPTDNVLTAADTGRDRSVSVRASWDLDRLLLSTERIRVIDEVQDAVKLREAVLGDVTRLYFERRRHQVDMLLAPKPDLMGRVRDELRLRELTAGLDALTGGRFSAEAAAVQR